MKTYEEAVQRLATESFHLYMQGSWSCTPDGVSVVAWIYGREQDQVEDDVWFHRDAMIVAQSKK